MTFEGLLELGDLTGSASTDTSRGSGSCWTTSPRRATKISAQSEQAIAGQLASKVLRARFAALRDAQRGRGRLGRLLLDVRTSDRREAYLRIPQ